MNSKHAISTWDVDLEARLASSGAVLVRFNQGAGHAIGISFVRGAENRSLEWQCQVAGAAIAAIQARLREG